MKDEIISNETRLTRIQLLVVEILNDLLRAPIEQTDESIQRAIARIGAYCHRDRSYVFIYKGEVADNTHEWCADGIDPMIEHLQGLPIEMYGPVAQALADREPVHVPDVALLPEGEHFRELLEPQGIRSILLVPMHYEGATYGFVGFDGVRLTHEFIPGEIYLLQSVADVICTVLVRREKDREVRQAQSALATERAFLASILATSALGIVVIGDGGRIQFVNKAASEVLGVPVDAFEGKRHDDPAWAYTRADGTPFGPGETPYDIVLATGADAPPEIFAMEVPAGTRYFAVHAAPVASAEGASGRVVYAVVDVTDQVQAERAREEALAEAERANAAKSNFLAKMSHEMRTPLNGVLGVAEVLERLITDSDQRRMVKVMHDSGALLLSIINDLLDMSKIEADLLELDLVPFVPADLAQRVDSVHTLRASEKRLSFSVVVVGDGASPRLGDPHRLLQILHNVISNAIKFTESGAVSVTLDCTLDDRLSLAVRDTGIGMTDAQRAQVFEEFGQADSSIARRFGGTGLGMPIVRRLVEMMGGSIDLQTEAGAGTLVSIDLPLGVTDLVQAPAQPPAATDWPDIRGLRVLAADDNRTNRMILGAMMGQLGIAAVLVPDGAEALRAFDREVFDLVILDISMPDMDGIAVLDQIRKREARRGRAGPPLPVVAFTANAMSHQVASYLAAGFDDCLTKPLQIDRLTAALGRLIGERGRRREGLRPAPVPAPVPG